MKIRANKIALVISLLLAGNPILAAPTQAEVNHDAVLSLHPLMIVALEGKEFTKARVFCQTLIELEPANAAHYYNLACVEARVGGTEAAFAALNRSNHLGMADTELLGSDPDLASLRKDPRYNEVMLQTARNAINLKAASPAPAAPSQTPAKPALNPSQPLTRATPAPASGPAQAPAAAKLTASGPVGLYYMTRYWIATGNLEKATWYFSPDGMAYENPTGDFSPASLVATASDQGKISLSGKNLTFTATKGKETGKPFNAEYDPQPAGGFYWNTGSFIPVPPLPSAKTIIGKWQGGFSVTGAMVARSLELRADGTFNLSGAATLESRTDGNEARAGASGQISSGKWTVSGYFMTLTGTNGATRRSIAFPFGSEKAPANPDYFYFDGIMWSPIK